MKLKDVAILAAVGIGGYWLVSGGLAKTISDTIRAGAEGTASGVGSAGADIIGAGFQGAENAVGDFMSYWSNALGGLLAIPGAVIASIPALGSVSGTTRYEAPKAPVSTITTYRAETAPQRAIAAAFNIPMSSVSSGVNYASFPGKAASFTNAGATMSGKYNASTGTFMNTAGQGFSVPSYIISAPKPSPAPAKPPLLTTTLPKYFR